VAGIFHPFVVFVKNVEKVVGLFFFLSKENIVVNGVCCNGHIIHDCDSILEELKLDHDNDCVCVCSMDSLSLFFAENVV
jgi:hypothetical protein